MQAEDGIRDVTRGVEFRRVLFRSVEKINSELGGTVSAAASSPTERSTNSPEPREEK